VVDKINTDKIFTSQGWLVDALKDPGLDLIMNIFRIPRVFAVGGFDGTWNVGKHSFLTAILAIFWARNMGWSEQRRNRLVIQALLHDLHESVTGDILPMFKTKDVKKELMRLQEVILESLCVEMDDSMSKHLKLVDLIAFLYEIKKAPVQILDSKKVGYASEMVAKQMDHIMEHCEENKISKTSVRALLKEFDLI
jgi:hypothetical protein